MSTQWKPQDYHSLTPFVIVPDSREFQRFLKVAFGAEPRDLVDDSGFIIHGESMLGDSVIMYFDRREGWPRTPAFLSIYVEDCDATIARACKHGARLVTSPVTLSWGDRAGRIVDPMGNLWWIQTHVADVDWNDDVEDSTPDWFVETLFDHLREIGE